MCFVKHIVIQMRRNVSYTYTYGVMYQSILCMICVHSIIFQFKLSSIYVTFSFRRSFIINSKIYMQEMVKCYGRITHLHRPNRIRIQIQWEHVITCPRITEQTVHVLETEIVAGVFPPVAEDDNEYSIVPYSALQTFATFVHTIQSSHVCSRWLSPESSKVKWSLKKNIYPPNSRWQKNWISIYWKSYSYANYHIICKFYSCLSFFLLWNLTQYLDSSSNSTQNDTTSYMIWPIFQSNKYFDINKNGNRLVIELSYLLFIFDAERLK